jgi:hypothetical protein
MLIIRSLIRTAYVTSLYGGSKLAKDLYGNEILLLLM